MISSTEEKMDQRAVTRNASNAKLTVEMAMLSPSASSWNDSGIGMDANFINSQIKILGIRWKSRSRTRLTKNLNQSNYLYARPMTSSQTSPTTAQPLSINFKLDRERNVIIHGIDEDGSTDDDIF